MSNDLSRHVASVRKLMSDGRYQEVIDECRGMLFDDPENEDVLSLLREANAAIESGEEVRPSAEFDEEPEAEIVETTPVDDAMGEPEEAGTDEPPAGNTAMTLEERLSQEFGGDATEAPSDLGDDDQARVTALVDEGQAYFDDGRFQHAIDVWSRIFIVDLNNSNAQKLIERARVALEEDQRKWDELIQEGNDHLDAEEFEQAAAKFNQVLQASPNHAEAVEGLERIEQHHAEASEKADKSKELMSKGAKLFQDGKVSEAIYTWEKLLEIDPNNQRAREYLSEARQQMDQPVTGADMYAEAAPAPSSAATIGAPAGQQSDLLSAAYSEEESLPEAPEIKSPLPKFLAIAGVAALIVAAAIFFSLGRETIDFEAIDAQYSEVGATTSVGQSAPVEDVIPPALDPATVELLEAELSEVAPYLEARTAFEEGRYADSVDLYQLAQQEAPDNALLRQQFHRSQFNLGVLAARSGSWSEATSRLEAALALEPEDSVAKRVVAAITRNQSNADERLTWFAQLVPLRR